VQRFRLLGIAVVAIVVFFSLASSAFAFRSYIAGSQITGFSAPSGVAVDGSDNVWVSDVGSSSVTKFDSSGTQLATNTSGPWNGSGYILSLAWGSGANLMYVGDSNLDDIWALNVADATDAGVDIFGGGWDTAPHSGNSFIHVAVDNSGGANEGDDDIYVVSSAGSVSTGSITRVDGSGTPDNFSATQTYITGNQITGTPTHSFAGLYGVVVDASGNVYAVDAGNNEVDEFHPDGSFFQAFTDPSFVGLSGPLTLDPTTGDVLVADGNVIHEFDSTGTLIDNIDGFESPAGSIAPQGLAVDSTGKLYVTDGNNQVVDAFGPNTATSQNLTVTCSGSGGGTVSAGTGGNDACNSVHEVTQNGSITLHATPNGSSVMTGWTVDGDATVCPGTGDCTVPVGTSDHTVVATFEATQTLTVNKIGSGTGTVTSTPSGIDCGATCNAPFNANSSVTLHAAADAHNAFIGWVVDGDASVCPGTADCVVDMGTSDHTVTAEFEPITQTLTVTKGGAGTGTVTSSPAGINCGGTCSHAFNEGTAVTLTASAAAGSTFAGWSGGGCSGTGACHVTVNAATTVTATFNTLPTTRHNLTVSCAGTGSGSVSPVGCGHTQVVNTGSSVTLTATPASGSTFAGWSGGGCSGTGTCTVKVNANTTVTATFTGPQPGHCTLKLAKATASVTGGKAAIALSNIGTATCSGKVTLTAKLKVRKGHKTKTKTVTIGSASINIAPGGHATVKVRLNRAALKVLAKKHSLKATLTGPNRFKHTVVLKSKAKKKKHHH